MCACKAYNTRWVWLGMEGRWGLGRGVGLCWVAVWPEVRGQRKCEPPVPPVMLSVTPVMLPAALLRRMRTMRKRLKAGQGLEGWGQV